MVRYRNRTAYIIRARTSLHRHRVRHFDSQMEASRGSFAPVSVVGVVKSFDCADFPVDAGVCMP